MQRRWIVAMMLTLGLVAAACGDDTTGGSASSDEPAATGPASGASAATTTSAAPGPVTITDGTGTTVTLGAPAKRVVALEWTYAEDLLLLGVEPVGVADVKNYASWVTDPDIPSGVTDVGTRQEPSLERIAALKPDLIIGVSFRHAAARDKLQAIAPTVLFNPYPKTGTQYQEMRDTFTTIASVTATADKAKSVLADLDATIAATKATVASKGLAGTNVAIAQTYTTQGKAAVRMFTGNSMSIEVLVAVGLKNGWPGANEEYGFNTVDLEGMTKLAPDAELLYIAQASDDPFVSLFPGNPLWDNLGPVKAKKVTPIGADTWTFGGPASNKAFLDRAVRALTS